MKKYLLLTAVFLASVFSMHARDFTDPGNAYQIHEVVYVAFKLPSGNLLGSVNGQLGAFVDGTCRAVAVQETAGTTSTTYLFTLNMGVTAADAGKTVTLALNSEGTEYTFETNLTLTGSEGTLAGNYPSNPYYVTFNPVERVSADSRIDINMGETLDLMTVMKFEGKEANAVATMPDAITWDFMNSSDYFTVANNVLTPKAPNMEGLHLGYSFSAGANSINGSFQVYVHQPITGIAINTADYPKSTITVNEGAIDELNSQLANILVITPENATESVEWKLTEGETTGLVLENGKWNPKTKGEYTMQASAYGVDPVSVKVIVLKPAEALIQSITELNVIVGDEVTQYLPYTFTISPEDASHQFDYVTYEIPEGTTDNYLVKNENGTITALTAGTATINIKHADIESTYQVTIHVKDFPKAEDYTINANQLSISLKSSELSTLDLTTALTNNVIGNSAFMKFSFPSAFTFAEVNETPILQQSVAASGITAKTYGSTTVKWTYSTKAAKLETTVNGTTLNEGAPYVATISYALNIVAGLNSIDVIGVVAGLTDGDVVLKLVTNPVGMILEESDITWSLSDQNNPNDGPVFELGTRVEGKNEWNVTPLRICNNAVIGLQYSDEDVQVDTAKVTITQRLTLKEGWSWPSLYAGGIIESVFSELFSDDVQAVRSRTQITYNDDAYGFFGKLKAMTTDQGYKMQIKDTKTLNVLVPNDGSYSNSEGRSVALDPRWNWVSNPYCTAHSLSEVFGNVVLAENSEIRSKNGGFATYTENGWEGSLTIIEPGEAYLIYNAGEQQVSATLPAENSFAQTSTSEASVQQAGIYSIAKSVWEYDGSRFADNMSIIAKGTSALEQNRYSIGAFVAGECRGEGKMIGERFYITVHGATGDKIELKLYDMITDEIIDLASVLTFASSAGTYSQPYPIDTNNVSGINDVNVEGGVVVNIDGDNIVVCGAEEDDVKVYNACGMQVPATGISSGVYLVKVNTPQGVVTKKIIKK